jgi:hypothetical protein
VKLSIWLRDPAPSADMDDHIVFDVEFQVDLPVPEARRFALDLANHALDLLPPPEGSRT